MNSNSFILVQQNDNVSLSLQPWLELLLLCDMIFIILARLFFSVVLVFNFLACMLQMLL